MSVRCDWVDPSVDPGGRRAAEAAMVHSLLFVAGDGGVEGGSAGCNLSPPTIRGAVWVALLRL